jgi:hypothetical protein
MLYWKLNQLNNYYTVLWDHVKLIKYGGSRLWFIKGYKRRVEVYAAQMTYISLLLCNSYFFTLTVTFSYCKYIICHSIVWPGVLQCTLNSNSVSETVKNIYSWLAAVVHTCNSSYLAGGGLWFQTNLCKKLPRPCLNK